CAQASAAGGRVSGVSAGVRADGFAIDAPGLTLLRRALQSPTRHVRLRDGCIDPARRIAVGAPTAGRFVSSAWLAGDFVGDYIGEPDPASDTPRASSVRHFRVQIIRGTLRNARLCEPPEADSAVAPL